METGPDFREEHALPCGEKVVLRHIQPSRLNQAARFSAQLAQLFVVPCSRDDMRTKRRQVLRDCTADTPARARHNSNFALQNWVCF